MLSEKYELHEGKVVKKEDSKKAKCFVSMVASKLRKAFSRIRELLNERLVWIKDFISAFQYSKSVTKPKPLGDTHNWYSDGTFIYKMNNRRKPEDKRKSLSSLIRHRR